MHEVVTLQFGQQANYVGTHFWNSQESYFTYGTDEESPIDHDIHFRPGIGSDGGETYTPRTVIYDLKGAFGTLRQENALYQLQSQDDAGQHGQWPGQAQVIQQPAIPQSEYQRHLNDGVEPPPLSTSSVRYWSDYNRVFYHPKSVVQLHEYELNSSLAPFERWATGEELFSNLNKEHDLLDRDLRPFLEECDQLQALQLFTSTDDAWGGFASTYMESIRDELGKTSLWVWGLEDGTRKPRDHQLLSTANVIESIASLTSTASLYIPITSLPTLPPFITSFDPTSKWHTSGLQLSALESATLPTRLRSDQPGKTTFADIEAVLSNDGKRRIAHLSLSASATEATPNGTHHDGDRRLPTANGVLRAEDTDADPDNGTMQLAMDLTPACTPGATTHRQHDDSRAHIFAQLQSLRGTHVASLEVADRNAASRDRRAAAASGGVRVSCHQSPLLFNLASSFPRIFATAGGGKVAASAALTVSARVSTDLRALERVGRRCLAAEDREAICDGLLSLAGEYEGEWSEGSDEDE